MSLDEQPLEKVYERNLKMVNPIAQEMINTYLNLYKSRPAKLIIAPGRINLIGEHTDYSDGYVLPVAINLGIMIAMSPRTDKRLRLFSVDFNEYKEIELSKLTKYNDKWAEYFKGVAWVLQENGHELKGWQGVIKGTIPVGAGLSSSAALEIAAIQAFCISSEFSLSSTTKAHFGRKAEMDWVGVNVGIMDQLISASGMADHAVLLDCQTMDMTYIPIPQKARFVVLDTMTRRQLTNSAYNKRHEEVEIAAKALGISTLREASRALLEEKKTEMSETIFRRAKHVLTENDRVLTFSTAMQMGDLEKMGQLLTLSHASLRDDFEVSSKELNLIVEIASKHPLCMGARMTGAGFGGCALALVNDGDIDGFINQTSHNYSLQTGYHPHIFSVKSEDGVRNYDL